MRHYGFSASIENRPIQPYLLNHRGDRYMMYTLSDVPLLLGLRVERYSAIIFTLRSRYVDRR